VIEFTASYSAAWRSAKLRVGWTVAGCSPGIPRILISYWFQVTTSRPDPGRKAAPDWPAPDAWRAPVAARVVAAEAGNARVVETVAAAAAAVIAAAIARRVLDAPGLCFSLVKVRMSTNTLSRRPGFNRLSLQLENSSAG
jgi:hypothetical protein